MKKVISVLTLSLLVTTFGASTAFAGEGYYIQQRMQERIEKQNLSQETCEDKKQNLEVCESKQQKQNLKQEILKDETSKPAITPISQLEGGR